jgi:hypothetical protein
MGTEDESRKPSWFVPDAREQSGTNPVRTLFNDISIKLQKEKSRVDDTWILFDSSSSIS